uniref:PRA1 family protein n=1 Tax=Pinguiococcus pyrenoidosus TaxID=172671 RepID=A0A6U0VGU5_9STRA|mmetsp:Transcript_4636/g.18512  ORF Transcript_4636/g.18512 Transcript_4636/m.18512 type:complete len:235 (+) Transcript_4636:214-918(+)
MLEDIFGPQRSEQILEELREGLSQLRALGLRSPISWGEFLQDLEMPQNVNMHSLQQRVTANFLYFRGNYTVVVRKCALAKPFLLRTRCKTGDTPHLAIQSAVTIGLFVLFSPVTIFVLVCAFLGMVALQVTRSQAFIVQGHNVDFRSRTILLGVLTLLLAIVTGALGTVLIGSSIASTLSMAHMVCKSPSPQARLYAHAEERKFQEADLEGGSAPDVQHFGGEMRHRRSSSPVS